jgi:hypothetical protein
LHLTKLQLENIAPVHDTESLWKRQRVFEHAGLQRNKLKDVALLDNRAVLVPHAAAAATGVDQHLRTLSQTSCASVSGNKVGNHRITRVPRRKQRVERQKVNVEGLDVFASHFIYSCLIKEVKWRESADWRRVHKQATRGWNNAIQRCAHYLKNFKAPWVAFTGQNLTRVADVRCRLRALVAWSSARISDSPACTWSQRGHRHAAAAILLPQCATAHKPVFVQIDWRTP